MKISVMWMTRNRPYELIYSLSSFIIRAKNNSDVEYIVISDPDDVETSDALKKIKPMVFDTDIISLVAPQRYGYEELEMYQNQVGKVFTGECLLIVNDDIICLNENWDEEIRKVLRHQTKIPRWIGLSGVNEKWKGSTTFVGINRKWYEVTNKVSGNRSTDGYISDLGKKLNLDPLRPTVEMLHLQRGKGEINFIWDNKYYTTKGLDDDGLGGYPTKNPKPPKYYHDPKAFTNKYTDFVEGKRRFDEDLENLRRYHG